MKKFALLIAAATAVATVTPALAETVAVRVGEGGFHHRHVRERVVIREHRDHGWHRGWAHRHHGAKIVIR